LSAPPVHWWPAPAVGEIVWCLWPNKGKGSLPGPKPRPCLLLELDDKIPGQPHVLVAYGTSQAVTQLHTGKFVWFELLTQDIDKAMKFYDALLGWRSSRE
jgi:bleomycin resistance family protein